MMRSPGSLVVAVRRPDGSIAIREQGWVTLAPKLKFLRWPLMRGAVVLLESLHNGFSALQFSAEQAEVTTAPAPSAPVVSGSPAPAKQLDLSQSKAAGGSVATTAMMVVATATMMALFIATPPTCSRSGWAGCSAVWTPGPSRSSWWTGCSGWRS